MFKLFKKTLAVCLIGIGLRFTSSSITSIFRLDIYNRFSIIRNRGNLDFMLKPTQDKIKESVKMTIVVKKVPKFLKGFVKFIFRVK